MDWETYVGHVRQIITKKTAAADFAETMANHFVKAREAGYGSNQTAYTVYFDLQKLLTAGGKSDWHGTQIKKLWEMDAYLVGKRDPERSTFERNVRFFIKTRDLTKKHFTDQDWDNFRTEYFTSIDDLIERTKVICAVIRGDTPPERSNSS